jgi:uncharacterized protein (TIGR00251 family)
VSCRLRLRVVPNARRNEVVGTHGEAIKVKVAAPALDGRANEELIEFIADSLRVSRRGVRLVHGAKSCDKVLEVDELDEVAVRGGLLPSQ